MSFIYEALNLFSRKFLTNSYVVNYSKPISEKRGLIMKKMFISLFLGVLITTGLAVSSFSSFASVADAKPLRYTVTLHPNETYQLGYGPGYWYYMGSGKSNDFTVSPRGLIKIYPDPENISVGDGAYAGEISTVDRFGGEVETVTIRIKY